MVPNNIIWTIVGVLLIILLFILIVPHFR